jgi:3-methyladenine DNA glycosylase Tag
MRTKKVILNNLQDTSVIKMKGRILCIVSDTENYAFISSLFENFKEIIDNIIEVSPPESTENLRKIDFEEVSKKSNFMKIFLIAAILFLTGFGIYNLI